MSIFVWFSSQSSGPQKRHELIGGRIVWMVLVDNRTFKFRETSPSSARDFRQAELAGTVPSRLSISDSIVSLAAILISRDHGASITVQSFFVAQALTWCLTDDDGYRAAYRGVGSLRDDGVVLRRDVHLGQVPLVVNVVRRPLTLVPGQRGGHTHFVVKVHRGRVAVGVGGALVAGRLLLRRLIPVRRPRFHLERGHNVVTG